MMRWIPWCGHRVLAVGVGLDIVAVVRINVQTFDPITFPMVLT